MGLLSRIFGIKRKNDAESKIEITSNKVYPFKTMVVSGEKAIDIIRDIQKNGNGYPVIMGDPEGLDSLIESLEGNNDSFEEILKKSEAFDLLKWIEDRKNGFGEDWEYPHNEWVEGDGGSREFTVPYASTGKPLKNCVIGILDVKESWEVPAILKYGGWNDCPNPSDHVALFRKWEKEYSAKVTCITGDVIEFTVMNPPKNRNDAMKLANEQYLYCSDIVDQGVESIENLAALLMNSDKWYFWWD